MKAPKINSQWNMNCNKFVLTHDYNPGGSDELRVYLIENCLPSLVLGLESLLEEVHNSFVYSYGVSYFKCMFLSCFMCACLNSHLSLKAEINFSSY